MKIEEKIQNFAPVVITLESEEEVVLLSKIISSSLLTYNTFAEQLLKELRKIENTYIPF